MNINLKELEVWFVVGSQDLYGEETLRQVALHAEKIAHYLDTQAVIPVAVKYKPLLRKDAADALGCIPFHLQRCGSED